MNASTARRQARAKRQARVRRNILGTQARPRLSVFRSSKHIYAQIIEDETGKTLAAASTVSKDIAGDLKFSGNVEAAKAVGTAIAKIALDKNIKLVVFDRNGFLYHGRIKSLADGIREAGLQF